MLQISFFCTPKGVFSSICQKRINGQISEIFYYIGKKKFYRKKSFILLGATTHLGSARLSVIFTTHTWHVVSVTTLLQSDHDEEKHS